MTFVGLTVLWLSDVVTGILWMITVLCIVRFVVEVAYGGRAPIVWTLRELSEPLLKPLRRALGGNRLRHDFTPLVAAAIALLLQFAVRWVGFELARPLLGGVWFHRAGLVGQLLEVIRFVVRAYLLVVLVRIAATWFGSPEYHPFMRFLRRLVDPPLAAIRRVTGRRSGRLDWSPFVLMSALWFVDQVVIETLQLTL